MKILAFALLSLISSPVFAALPMQALLDMPIEERVKEFKTLKSTSYTFLSQAAFDAKNGLQTRWRAITTMGRLDPQAFRKDLDRALVSREWFMRNAALIALQTDDRPRAVAWSSKMLNDPALVVRTQAVRNLLELEARECEPQLWEQIFSRKNFSGKESLWVRVHIAEALAHFATRERIKLFQRLLMDPDERLHKWAILGLENGSGFKMSGKEVPLEIRREQWLARLGVQEI